ncbi:MAG: YdeI/OmpD-associated family protein [Ginsengibacter sp.]
MAEKTNKMNIKAPMNPRVDFFFSNAKKWQKEFEELSMFALDCGLTEELKWGVPCYTFQKKNVVLIHGFKEYCALLFFKGVLLKDPKTILIQQTENVQSARQVRFTNIEQIIEMEPILKTYIFEAIEVEKAGLKVPLKRTSDYSIPEEFQIKIDANKELKSAFEALTPGRQKAYIFYFSQPKLSKTREARIEKYITNILKGKGIDD